MPTKDTPDTRPRYWKPALVCSGGHRYFWEMEPTPGCPVNPDTMRIIKPYRLAIADNSGRFPHECDDGTLYVDLEKMQRKIWPRCVGSIFRLLPG